MSRARRIDDNQKAIVAAYRALGASVQSLASVGRGTPDLLVGFRGKDFLIEVKNSAQPPSARRLTDDEAKWHRSWRGSVVRIVESVDDVQAALGLAPWRGDV